MKSTLKPHQAQRASRVSRVREWLSDKWFAQVHGKNLVYNTCWEDPRLDRQALELKSDDVVLVITSAGCNALDYALDAPKRIHAVDMNPRQNALLELKQAGIRKLDHATFFQIFGKGAMPGFRSVYHDALRADLSPATQKYWDRRFDYFLGQGRRKSFYFHGTSGVFAWMANVYVDRIAKVRDSVNAILEAPTVDAQREIYHRKLGPKMFGKLIRWLLDRDATMALLGVPRPQRIQIERTYGGGLVRFIEDCVETVFAKLPLRDNYFWRVYLTGEYTPECCPNYLTTDGFARLKGGLVDLVQTHTDSVAGFVRKCDEPISRFILLDHQDWLSTHRHNLLVDEWQTIVDRASPTARILFRSGGMEVDFVDPIEVRVNGTKRKLGDMLHYYRELAASLHTVDRVHTYGNFYIADLRR
jgi:S-adenosylmethionine-diacylglycerol 3-amino-3-carboxypropyl transferase